MFVKAVAVYAWLIKMSLAGSGSGVGVGSEVGLAPASVGDVGVQLGGREVGVAEHLLDAA